MSRDQAREHVANLLRTRDWERPVALCDARRFAPVADATCAALQRHPRLLREVLGVLADVAGSDAESFDEMAMLRLRLRTRHLIATLGQAYAATNVQPDEVSA